MKPTKIFDELSDEQLKKLFTASEPTHSFKFGVKSALLTLYLPYFVVGLVAGFNQEYTNISLVVFVIIAIARKISKEKIFDDIFVFVYGLSFYALLISSHVISLNFFTLIVVIGLYTVSVKFIKLSLFKSFVEQKVLYNKTGLSNKESAIVISISVAVTTLLGDSITDILLIFSSYLLSIILASFTFNPYYYSEQIRLLKLKEGSKKVS